MRRMNWKEMKMKKEKRMQIEIRKLEIRKRKRHWKDLELENWNRKNRTTYLGGCFL